MAPVILKTFVHCPSCAGRIQKAIKKYLGVEEVLVSVDTGLIVVTGTNLDALFLKWKIQSKVVKRCRVEIISDGTVEEPPPPPPQYAAPPPGYPYPYYPYNYYGGTMAPQLTHPAYSQPPPPPAYPYGAAPLGTWVPAAPPQHLLQYVPAEHLYARQQYMPNEAPLWFNDDNPNGCCAVQ
ncbi:unnamed protein product [Urochloa decumbens]|uniref:HMA domain-containing protein n=1 Tax=Urochloa decumbens TaxID=240449 RepID=A0ABC8X386_9POAL